MAQPQINLVRMYLKGVSLEHPAAPIAFLEENAAPVQDNLNVQVNVTPLNQEFFEVSVRATLTLSREEKTLYVLEAEQAGIFQLTDVPAEDVDGVLGVNAAAMVYSYLRVSFADLMSRATLPVMHLPEVNWLGQFQERMAQGAPRIVPAAGAANDTMH